MSASSLLLFPLRVWMAKNEICISCFSGTILSHLFRAGELYRENGFTLVVQVKNIRIGTEIPTQES